MPAEYTNCWKSLVKKGTPTREAKGRCAASFFKRHGITVNEAHKRGIAELEIETEGLDWDFVEAILDPMKRKPKEIIGQKPPTTVQTLLFDKSKFDISEARKWAKGHGYRSDKVDSAEGAEFIRLRQRNPGDFKDKSFKTITLRGGVKAVIGHLKTATAELYQEGNVRFPDIAIANLPDDEGNIFTLRAAKIGSPAVLAGGWIVTWREDSLRAAAHTFTGGRVTINHQKIDTPVGIIDSHMDEDFLLMTVETSDDLAEHIRKHFPEVGVSIEADLHAIDIHNLEILEAVGIGISFLFYPLKGGCTLESGCTIIAKEQSESEVRTMSECSECARLKAQLDEQVALVASKDLNVQNLQTKAEKLNEELESLRSFKEKTEDEIKTFAQREADFAELSKEKEAMDEELTTLRASHEEMQETRKTELLARIEAAGLDTKPYEAFEASTLEVVANALVSIGEKAKENEVESSGAKKTKAISSAADDEDAFDYDALKAEETRLLKGLPLE